MTHTSNTILTEVKKIFLNHALPLLHRKQMTKLEIEKKVCKPAHPAKT